MSTEVRYLLDTNIISDLVKQPQVRVAIEMGLREMINLLLQPQYPRSGSISALTISTLKRTFQSLFGALNEHLYRKRSTR